MDATQKPPAEASNADPWSAPRSAKASAPAAAAAPAEGEGRGAAEGKAVGRMLGEALAEGVAEGGGRGYRATHPSPPRPLPAGHAQGAVTLQPPREMAQGETG